MLVMLCTRCQQREAQAFGSGPEKRAAFRAKFEAEFGAPWPFPDDLCRECASEWFKSPEGKAQLEPFRRAMEARWREDVQKWKRSPKSEATLSTLRSKMARWATDNHQALCDAGPPALITSHQHAGRDPAGRRREAEHR